MQILTSAEKWPPEEALGGVVVFEESRRCLCVPATRPWPSLPACMHGHAGPELLGGALNYQAGPVDQDCLSMASTRTTTSPRKPLDSSGFRRRGFLGSQSWELSSRTRGVLAAPAGSDISPRRRPRAHGTTRSQSTG